MRSFGWALSASLIIIGSFFIASAPIGPYRMGVAGAGWEEGIFLIGPAIGAFVAAHAIRLPSLRILGFGVVLSFALLAGVALLFFHAFADGSTIASGRSLRVVGLYLAGGGLGAFLGTKLRRRPEVPQAPLLWFVVGGFLSISLIGLSAALTVQVSAEPVVIGLVSIALGPLLGGLIATVMAPVYVKFWISLSTAAVPMLCMLGESGEIGAIISAFLMLWLSGWIGVKIGQKLSAKTVETLSVPLARVEE